MKNFITKKVIIGLVVGAIVGSAYFYFNSCQNGTCSLKSNPYITILFFSLAGGVLMSGSKKDKNKNEDQDNTKEAN